MDARDACAIHLVIRYGVVAREETYLDRKFGAVYLSYKSRVHRWL
jgi:protein-S-isoprenylcysteine O-methyltransferase Ste14